ncbi:MAG: amino acid ABC transporter permease, partial [Bradyrhizobium sp.]
MSDITPSVFVREELVGERPAPIKTTGFVGFLRTRLFNSPTNILITIVCALLLWFIVVPAVRFVLIDAVWTGSDRTACLAKNAGDVVGACWPFIQAKFTQFIYGFYPEAERWRVNLTFFLAVALLGWLAWFLVMRCNAVQRGQMLVLLVLIACCLVFFTLY